VTAGDSFRIALVQMVSTPSVAENLDAAGRLIAEAAGKGAKLIALPEYFCILGQRDTDKVAAKEKDGAGPIQEFLAETARRHGIWLVGGSVPLECADPGKVRNSCLVYDSEGRRVARYDKIHLFGLELGAERFDEGRTIEAGATPCAIDSPFGRIAISVCYDVRFPELYRALAPMDLILVPSAFTATTGRAHWETLLRARAIENLAWVLAPAQGGTHPNGRQTHGHTMVVDPWGKVVAERAAGAGVVVADIDPRFQARMRHSLPALTHRVLRGRPG
jgi:predicted amidohydrolase